MNELPEREPESAEATFATFLDLREEDPSTSFESWVAGRPDADRLRTLHGAFEAVRRHLPEAAIELPDDLSSRTLEAGFEVLGPLGHGGYGEVFRARDRILQREVALKVLGREARIAPDMRRRFLEEARVLARLNHSNIVRIHSIDSHEGEIRLSLELIEGRTLQQIVEDEGPFSPEEAAHIGIDLCRALAAIHAEGLVHMDIKPGNVMRAAGGRIVLLDFGFARASDVRAGREGSPVGGTPPFMSPEHFEGRTDIGPRSDVYSLGVLLYWTVTGRYPYQHDDFADLSAKVLAGEATPLLDVRPDATAGLAEILERAMAREESARFPSAGEMESALRRFVAGQAATSTGPRDQHTVGRRSLLIAVCGALLLLGGLWLAAVVSGGDPFELEHSFFEGSGQDSTPLSDGDAVHVGDTLHLLARSSTAFYLYVFNQDERGNWYRLVPKEAAPGLHEKDVRHRFPRRGYWEVDSVGDTEHMYVFASPHRIPFAEELVAIIPPTGKNQGDLTRGEKERLRGVGSTTEPEVHAGSFDLEAEFAGFEASLTEADAVYAAHLRLRNEGR